MGLPWEQRLVIREETGHQWYFSNDLTKKEEQKQIEYISLAN